MKQKENKFTVDAFNKRGRGKPPTPHAKSNAQRQREFRQRTKFNFLNNSVMRNEH